MPDPIETLLRKAPRPHTPRDLRARLIGEMQLPKPQEGQSIQLWWRRWVPIGAYGAITLTLAAGIHFQGRFLENQKHGMTMVGKKGESSRPNNFGNATPLAVDLEKVRRENAELKKLQQENAELHRILENKELTATKLQELREEKTAIESTERAEVVNRTERIQCVNRLKLLMVAVKVHNIEWREKHGNEVPVPNPTWTDLIKNVDSPKVFFCPGKTAEPPMDWASFHASSVDYRMVQDYDNNQPKAPFLHCRLHDHIAFMDGSAMMCSPEQAADLLKGR